MDEGTWVWMDVDGRAIVVVATSVTRVRGRDLWGFVYVCII